MRDRVLVLSFLAMIGLPPVLMFMLPRSAISQQENRTLAVMSWLELSTKPIREWPAIVEAYCKDHFAGRPQLVYAHAWLRGRLLESTTNARVAIGDDDWLYLAEEPLLGMHQGRKPLTPFQLFRWRRAFEAHRDWLAERGIGYLVVIVPDKNTIYPEHLPASFGPPKHTPREELLEYLAGKCDVDVIDLTPALMEAKSRGQIFRKADTHWNDLGAYAGYAAIVQRLQRRWNVGPPLPPSDFRVERRFLAGQGLANMLSLPDCFAENIPFMKRVEPSAVRVRVVPPEERSYAKKARLVAITEQDRPELPRCVIFHDSFFYENDMDSGVRPFLAEHFARAAWVWQHGLETQAIVDEKPDVVPDVVPDVIIEELVERSLDNPFDLTPELLPGWTGRCFKEAREVVVLCDPEHGFEPLIRGNPTARLESRYGVLHLKVGGDPIRLMLPDVAGRQRELLLLNIGVTLPAPATLTLSVKGRDFSEIKLPAGGHDVFLHCFVEKAGSSVRLDCDLREGELTLDHVELRAASGW